MRSVLTLIGFLAVAAQVVLLRELSVMSFGSELTLTLGLGLWLVSTAAGVAVGRLWRSPGPAAVSVVLLASASTLPLSLALSRDLRPLFGGTPGAFLPLAAQLAGSLLVLLPTAGLLGLAFQLAARRYALAGGSLARAYALESAGGGLGGLAVTVAAALGAQNLEVALFIAITAGLAALLPGDKPGWTRPAAGVLLTLIAVALVMRDPLDLALTAVTHPDVVASRDSAYGRITVTARAGQVVVFENDALAYDSEGTSAEELAHLAAGQRDTVGRVLLLGGSGEGLVREALQHAPTRVTAVELDGVELELVKSRLPASITESLTAPTVTQVVNDPRRQLDDDATYDLVIAALPEPDSGQNNRFYTREFFADVASHLSPGGVFAFRLRSSENLWTPAVTRRAASITRALEASFADVLVLPGTSNIFLASNRPLDRDPTPIAGRLEARGIRARLVTGAYVRYLYTNDRTPEIAAALASTPAAVNSDARPVCYPFTLSIWLAKFFPDLTFWDWQASAPTLGTAALVGLLVLAALLLLARRAPLIWRRSFLAFMSGALGLMLETLVILGYQVKSGVLFRDLGLLLTLFMVGLAFGAWRVDRSSRPDEAGRPRRHHRGGLVLLGMGVTALIAAGSLSSTQAGALWLASLLLFASGALTAALFAHASLEDGLDAHTTTAPLYAADVLGGAVAAMLTSLLLVPLLGLDGAALAVAALAGLTAILL